jgi:hypothetical protein
LASVRKPLDIRHELVRWNSIALRQCN